MSLLRDLDFIYMPSSDVVADIAYFTEVLDGRLSFAVEGTGARVAMIELTDRPPRILLADHLEGERPILVYRVEDLERALDAHRARGWKPERTFEIPNGPCCSFVTAGGHRLALYQLMRPEVTQHFAGRRDF